MYRPGLAVFLAIAVCCATVAGCAVPTRSKLSGGPVRVDASFDGSTVELVPGAQLTVALEGNPSTGYDWKVAETLPAQLDAGEDTFETTAASGVVGAGGTRVFAYTAAEAGTGVLELEYVRAWEKGVPPERTFRLTVTVK